MMLCIVKREGQFTKKIISDDLKRRPENFKSYLQRRKFQKCLIYIIQQINSTY